MAHRATAEDMQDYADFLECNPHAYITQSLAWPNVKKNWDVAHFIERDESGLVAAVAQMLYVKDARTGKVFAYIPRGPVTAGVGELQPSNEQAVLNIVKAACEFAQGLDAHTLLIDPQWQNSLENRALLAKIAAVYEGGHADVGVGTGVGVDDGASTSHHRLQGQPQLSMDIDLRPFGSYEEWLGAINRKKRYYIKQTEKNGLVAQIRTDREAVEDLYQLIVMTCDRQGITHRPKQYFYDLYDAFPSSVVFSMVEYEGQWRSASMNVIYGDTLYNLYAGNDLSYQHLQLPMSMNPGFIKEAFARGLSCVNLGGVFGVDAADSLYNFKKHFFPQNQDVTIFVGEVTFAW